MIVNNTINDRLLGCYLQKPSLTIDSKYPIDKDEWSILFQRILYASVYNLALSGCNSVSIFDITEFVKPYESEYNVLKDNNYEDYIATITDLVDAENFEYYYNEFKKISCLNTYKEEGFDIKQFFDEDKPEDGQFENLNKYKLEDIIDHFDTVQTKVKRKFSKEDDDTERKKAGENGIEILHSFKQTPILGLSFESKYLTTLWDGWRKKQL